MRCAHVPVLGPSSASQSRGYGTVRRVHARACVCIQLHVGVRARARVRSCMLVCVIRPRARACAYVQVRAGALTFSNAAACTAESICACPLPRSSHVSTLAHTCAHDAFVYAQGFRPYPVGFARLRIALDSAAVCADTNASTHSSRVPACSQRHLRLHLYKRGQGQCVWLCAWRCVCVRARTRACVVYLCERVVCCYVHTYNHTYVRT